MEEEINIPQDKCYYVYVVFYLLGIGNLIPWNFFINGKDRFEAFSISQKNNFH